ncbi:ROK family protein [Cucumibacter marinus]|uniref:ROK family protein n=1 Tax=Cucumibacter marinus TaxID=1121252 RepID=UPI00040C4C88|nr:ROK family protein [Cucumibacter marinus]
MSAILAIDLGGTNLRAGLLRDGAKAIEAAGHWPAPADRAGFLEMVGRLVSGHRPAALGVAVPGLTRGTTCAWIPNLPFLDGFDLASEFGGLDIALGNDAQLALLAEAETGAAAKVRHAILLAIGTGIGSAALVDGRIVRGAGGGATSFGWACADAADPGHGSDGWLERHASGRALDRIAKSIGPTNGAALIAAARQGDQAAITALTPVGEALGTALAGPVALLGTEAVIVSGGVADAMDVLEPLIRPSLGRQLPPHLRSITIGAGVLGAGASLLGAALAARGSELWERDQ